MTANAASSFSRTAPNYPEVPPSLLPNCSERTGSAAIFSSCTAASGPEVPPCCSVDVPAGAPVCFPLFHRAKRSEPHPNFPEAFRRHRKCRRNGRPKRGGSAAAAAARSRKSSVMVEDRVEKRADFRWNCELKKVKGCAERGASRLPSERKRRLRLLWKYGIAVGISVRNANKNGEFGHVLRDCGGLCGNLVGKRRFGGEFG